MRALKAAVPNPDALSIDFVQNSLAELTRIRDEISAAQTEVLARHSIDVRTVGLKHSTNNVTIRVAGDPPQAEPYFHARYGSGEGHGAFRVPKVADPENAGPPWRGARILSHFGYGDSWPLGYSAFITRGAQGPRPQHRIDQRLPSIQAGAPGIAERPRISRCAAVLLLPYCITRPIRSPAPRRRCELRCR